MAKQPSRPVGDIFLILFSLFLAFIVWVIVKQQESSIRALSIPITYSNLPEFVELGGYEPGSLTVEFSVPKAEESYARGENFKIDVDLSKIAVFAGTESFNEYTVDLNASQVTPSDGGTQIHPVLIVGEPLVTFLARLRVGTVPVEPNLQGSPAEGYRLDSEKISVEPKTITVAMNATRFRESIEGTLRVLTEPISIGGERDIVSGLYSVPLNSRDGLNQGIFSIPGAPVQKIEASIPLPEIETTRIFENVPVIYEPLRVDVVAEVEPSVVNVTVSGPRSAVDRVTPQMLHLSTLALIDDRPGTVVETVIDVTLETGDPGLRARIKSMETAPRTVLIRIESREQPTPAPAPSPTPRPSPSPTPVPPMPATVPLPFDESTSPMPVPAGVAPSRDDGESSPRLGPRVEPTPAL